MRNFSVTPKGGALGRSLLDQAAEQAQEVFIRRKASLPNVIQKYAMEGAGLRQLGGFGEGDLVESLKSGSLIPDDIFGWSTKTILAGVVVCVLIKRKLRGADK